MLKSSVIIGYVSTKY